MCWPFLLTSPCEYLLCSLSLSGNLSKRICFAFCKLAAAQEAWWTAALGAVVSGHGEDGLMVRLGNLKGLFQAQ